MEKPDIKLIEVRAREFRLALKKSDKTKLPITFEDFPYGSCGDASLLLARYLQESGFGEFNYVCGVIREDGDWYSHAWLQRDNLIIDITADQFEEIDKPVVVLRMGIGIHVLKSIIKIAPI